MNTENSHLTIDNGLFSWSIFRCRFLQSCVSLDSSYIVVWDTTIAFMVVMLLTMFLAFKVKLGVYGKVAAMEEKLAAQV